MQGSSLLKGFVFVVSKEVTNVVILILLLLLLLTGEESWIKNACIAGISGSQEKYAQRVALDAKEDSTFIIQT